MFANLQQLPVCVWVIAILAIVVASLVVFYICRNYKLGKLKLKLPWAEAELDRKDKPVTPSSAVEKKPAPPLRTQEMTRSEEGEQAMHGNKGGVQKQKMTNSPRGKQTMD